jgi:hypothetical protein
MQEQLPSCLLLVLLLLCCLRLGLHQHLRHHHQHLLLLLRWCPTWLVLLPCAEIPALQLRPTVLHTTALAALLLKPQEAA